MSHSPFSANGPSNNGDLDPVALLVGRFETLWFAGQRPALEPLLAEAGAARQAVLIELVHAELELRLKAGEAARVEDYLQRYPELSEDPGVELDLIRAEFRFRARRERELDLKEFQLRFPRWQLELEQLETPQSRSQKDTHILPDTRDAASGEWPVIPGMEVLAELGTGGMGIVYKVRQKTLNRYAAVKILRPGAREEERRRFQTEAEAAARLNHPRIARIHEVGEREGQPYLVLEYVEGGNLAQRLDGTPWPIREAAELVLHLAEAVQYAHDQGVLHRDLTPANVLLDSDGLPKISDFGLAKILVSSGVGPTRTEAVLGTPSYMSPEQAAGQARQVGPAADIYGLGAILYHLLTARPPFKGETSLETLRQVLTEEPLPLRRLRPTVPPDLETICLNCLQKRAGERYPSAASLAADLRCFLAGEPIKARPPSRWQLAWRWGRKHPATTALLAAGLLLAVVIVSGSLWHSIQLGNALEDTKRESARATQNEQRARQTLYASDLRLGYQVFKLGDVFRLDHLLERHTPSATDADPPGFEWRYLSQFRQSAPDTWRAHTVWLDWIGYSPDGLLFATAGQDPDGWSVKVWESATKTLLRQIRWVGETLWRGQPLAFFPGIPRWVAVCDGKNVIRLDPRTGQAVGKALTHSNWVTTVVISSDGGRIITGGDGPITVWDVATETVVRTFPPTSQSVHGMILTQQERKLVTFQPYEAQPHKLWDLSTGEATPTGNLGGQLFTNPAGTLLGGVIGGDAQVVLSDGHGLLEDSWFHSVMFRTTCAALSPDSRLLVLGCSDGGMRFYDLQTHRPHAYLRWQVREIVRVAFSPDGGTICAAIREGTIFQVQPPKRQEPDILHTTMNASGVLAYSPDGKTLAVADLDRTIKLVDPQTGQVRSALRGQRNGSERITFSCDGRMIATLSQGEVWLWDAATGQPRPMQFSAKANYLAFSPTKPLLAIGSETGQIDLWDVASFASAGSLRSHARAITALAFSPDGRTLASTSNEEVLHLWDCSGDRAPEKPFLSHSFKERVVFMAFLPDGRTLLSGGLPSKTVRFWHVGATSLTEEKNPLQLSGISQQLVLSRDGRTLLAPGEGGFVKQWDLSTGNRLSQLPTRILARSPTSDKLAISDAETGMIEVWNPDSWKANHLPGQPLNSLCSLAFSSDDRILFTGEDPHIRLCRIELYPWGQKLSSDSRLLRDAGASIREWNLEDGSERPRLSGPDVMAPPALVALSSDDRTLAAGGEDGCIYLWDRITRRFRQRLFVGPKTESYVPGIEYARRNPLGTNPHYPESVRVLAFCPGKELLVTASTQGVVTLWDSSKGQALRRFTVDPQQTRWVGFSPGGDLAISQESQLHFHDPVSGELKSTLGDAQGERIVCVAFSKDGSLVALGDQKHNIHLWNRQTGTEKGHLFGHIDQVNALAFTPDSKTLASASNDRTVKLWSVATLTEMASLEAHAGNVTCLAFNSAGTILATGGEEPAGQGQVFLWRVPPNRVVPR